MQTRATVLYEKVMGCENIYISVIVKCSQDISEM